MLDHKYSVSFDREMAPTSLYYSIRLENAPKRVDTLAITASRAG